jgi:hypothetical protein
MKTTALPVYDKDSSMYDDMLNVWRNMCAYNMAFGRHASKEGNIMAQQKRNTPLA